MSISGIIKADGANKIDKQAKNVDYGANPRSQSMKVSESDPRSIRTRALLRDTLMQLVAEKSFASLTIQDVTHLAGLNRTTFYLHYSGLHELLEDCARTLFGQMRSEIYGNKTSGFRQDPNVLAPYITSVFHHLAHHEKFYRAMLGRQGDPLFRVLFQELLSELIFEPMERAPDEPSSLQLEMILRFFSSGFGGIAEWWLEKGMPISAEQASQQVARKILPDYLRLMGN
jgi:AcrR family transcriptional regulator